VRRSVTQPESTVDELHPAQRLRELLPHCDWLLIACPLTEETRGLICGDARAAAARGACSTWRAARS
jgi:phosphoglycerate dehydrogenase-like enzyme